MKFKFINDLHLYAPNAILDESVFSPSNSREFYLGDNYDLANCKKSDVKEVQDKVTRLKRLYGGRFISGNHERQSDSDSFAKINNDVAVMHGDHIFWGEEKSKDYRSKPHGAGFLKRGLWVNALEAIENGYDRKISDKDLDRFFDFAMKINVKRIIVGHLHPSKQLDVECSGRVLTVLKRGATELEL